MKHFYALAGVAAFTLFAGVGAAQAAIGITCATGTQNSISVTVPDGGINTFAVENEIGSTVGFSAALTNASGTGGLGISGGSGILSFPSQTSAIVSSPMAAGTWLMLQAAGTDVTLTVTCNPVPTTTPASSVTTSGADASAAASNSQAIVKETAKSNLFWVVSVMVDSASWGVGYSGDLPENYGEVVAERLASADESERVGILDSVFGEMFKYHRDEAAYYRKILAAGGLTQQQKDAFTGTLLFHERRMEAISTNYRFAVSSLNYMPASASGSEALDAIDTSFARNTVVQNSFQLLGYGPTGGFAGNAILAQGNGWIVSASVAGAISQASVAAGDIRSMSGRGTINIAANIAPGFAMGLGLGVGATSEDGPTLDDRAYHYSADLMLIHRLTGDLRLSGGLGYELTSHNFTRGAGTGSASEHLYSANVGLSGDLPFRLYKLTPSLNVELSHQSQAAATLSDGTTLAGFDRTTGKATVGTRISQSFPVVLSDSFVVVEPYVGGDVSLSLFSQQLSTGATSFGTGYGLGLTGGVAMQFDNGMGLDVSGRVNRSGDTIGAGVTGKVSASF